MELDTRSFAVSRRFGLALGKEAAVAVTAAEDDHAAHAGMDMSHPMTPPTCSPTWAQPSVTGAKVYVACNKADEVVEIDRASWTITRRFKTGRGPYNLGVTPDGTLLLVTLKQGGSFQAFDLASGLSVMTITSSTTITNGVAVSPNSRYAFVSSEGVGAAPGYVDVYDLAAKGRAAAVPVGQQAGGIAFWRTGDR